MKQFLILSLALCLSAAVFSSCNNEDNTPEAPSISFKDNTDGTFYAKAGFPLTLTPQVENGDGAQYSWTLGGQPGRHVGYLYVPVGRDRNLCADPDGQNRRR